MFSIVNNGDTASRWFCYYVTGNNCANDERSGPEQKWFNVHYLFSWRFIMIEGIQENSWTHTLTLTHTPVHPIEISWRHTSQDCFFLNRRSSLKDLVRVYCLSHPIPRYPYSPPLSPARIFYVTPSAWIFYILYGMFLLLLLLLLLPPYGNNVLRTTAESKWIAACLEWTRIIIKGITEHVVTMKRARGRDPSALRLESSIFCKCTEIHNQLTVIRDDICSFSWITNKPRNDTLPI